MQQRLKPAPGAARTWIVAAEFLEQLLVAVHDAVTTLDVRLAEGTPGAVSTCAQKQGSDSRSRRFRLAIQPPSWSEQRNLPGAGCLAMRNWQGYVVAAVPCTPQPLLAVAQVITFLRPEATGALVPGLPGRRTGSPPAHPGTVGTRGAWRRWRRRAAPHRDRRNTGLSRDR